MDFVHSAVVIEFSASPTTETACGLVNARGEEMIWHEQFNSVDKRDRCPKCEEKNNEIL